MQNSALGQRARARRRGAGGEGAPPEAGRPSIAWSEAGRWRSSHRQRGVLFDWEAFLAWVKGAESGPRPIGAERQTWRRVGGKPAHDTRAPESSTSNLPRHRRGRSLEVQRARLVRLVLDELERRGCRFVGDVLPSIDDSLNSSIDSRPGCRTCVGSHERCDRERVCDLRRRSGAPLLRPGSLGRQRANRDPPDSTRWRSRHERGCSRRRSRWLSKPRGVHVLQAITFMSESRSEDPT